MSDISNRIKHTYDIGDDVWMEIHSDVKGIPISAWIKFSVVGINRESGTDSVFCTYDLSTDPCGPYYNDKGVQFARVREDRLFLEKP